MPCVDARRGVSNGGHEGVCAIGACLRLCDPHARGRGVDTPSARPLPPAPPSLRIAGGQDGQGHARHMGSCKASGPWHGPCSFRKVCQLPGSPAPLCGALVSCLLSGGVAPLHPRLFTVMALPSGSCVFCSLLGIAGGCDGEGRVSSTRSGYGHWPPASTVKKSITSWSSG